ncbi:MAG TPA: ATP-binding protein [Bacteroidia bacterium]|jgi:two-component system phosphate regulon sensor histidine kinase PhoR|nr:ATP-binding protein [Bacteroidia bacterium]
MTRSWIIAILIALFVYAILALSSLTASPPADTLHLNLWLYYPLVFILVLLFSWAVMEWVIFRRIRSVIGELRKLKEIGPEQKKKDASSDMLEVLNREVREWAVERKEEIDRLNRLEMYRKEYLGNVSHELKTPIFSIQGYILTLLEGGLDDPTINREYLQRAERSVDRMIAIVEDLQAITQLETGELELDIDRFELVALARDVIEAEEMRAKTSQIHLELAPDPMHPVYVMGDRFRIRQVLVNLVINSIRYGRENGETRVKIHDAGDRIIVEVADNGIGISKTHLPRIFERFYRVDKSRSRAQGGTGLGLAIVKHIIEAHKQTIEVISTEGVGSVFSFSLKKA